MTKPHNFNDIFSKLADARRSGDGWIASCPAPGHKTPGGHLSLRDGGNKALVTCQGGRHGYQDICQALRFDSLSYGNSSKPASKIVATYDYQDERGELLYQTVKYDPKDFKVRCPASNGGWSWNLKGVQLVLYAFPK